jgi:hypothetical protein
LHRGANVWGGFWRCGEQLALGLAAVGEALRMWSLRAPRNLDWFGL